MSVFIHMFIAVRSFASSAVSSISSAFDKLIGVFQSKPEIKSETLIMGVPAWTVVVGVGMYMYWSKKRIDDMERQHADNQALNLAINQALKQQIQELSTRLLEIERDEKDAMRREIADLKQQLKDACS